MDDASLHGDVANRPVRYGKPNDGVIGRRLARSPRSEACPVDVRLPVPAVLARIEQRPHLVEQRQPLVVGQVTDPAHRGEERHEPLAVDRLRIRKLRLLEFIELRVGERAAPRARLVARRAQVERVNADTSLRAGPRTRRSASTAAIDGFVGPDGRFHIRTNAPRERNTRASSNVWNASAAKTASTDAASSGIASALPATS
jgi:hypothetical protein